ncbi:MAG: hypothetical protein KIT14_14015 [bacterium]|nr:hypothetical protein [bacterium]MCW5891648.1 hypothetical protein [bacterium]
MRKMVVDNSDAAVTALLTAATTRRRLRWALASLLSDAAVTLVPNDPHDAAELAEIAGERASAEWSTVQLLARDESLRRRLRECPACGAIFLQPRTGGRGRPPESCSADCGRRARRERKTAAMQAKRGGPSHPRRATVVFVAPGEPDPPAPTRAPGGDWRTAREAPPLHVVEWDIGGDADEDALPF